MGGRLFLDVTAEVPVAIYPLGEGPDPARVAGVDLGIIHPYAAAGPDGEGLLVSGRAIRAEHRMHLADTKRRRRAVSRRAPKPGQRGSRRWRRYRRRTRLVEGRHKWRVRQVQHEAARMVVSWAVQRRVGVLKGRRPPRRVGHRCGAADPPPPPQLCCPGWSRTVEPADTSPVPASPDVTPAAHPRQREDQLARGGSPHHPGRIARPTARIHNNPPKTR
ncbi:hypothetical protein GCM10011608_40310 [Micromonospora sonchi]|uniref:Uncharacterized protein n=1 Tax=Micromonospora sonchi TaxID=1763543 RepID=A0A917U1E2_9ACTN|nr:hypothetical protein GCM10011608_40310 [Micromonospora sonchi]